MSDESKFIALAGVLIEGATDAFCGRPRSANPYSSTAATEANFTWAWGWDEGSAQLADRGQREAARWLAA